MISTLDVDEINSRKHQRKPTKRLHSSDDSEEEKCYYERPPKISVNLSVKVKRSHLKVKRYVQHN